MLSQGLIGVSHRGQCEAGATTEMPKGNRWITTFKKEPIASPNANAIDPIALGAISTVIPLQSAAANAVSSRTDPKLRRALDYL